MTLGHHYRILVRKGAPRSYDLLGGKKALATLAVEGRSLSRAVILNGGQNILLKREAPLKKHLAIENMNGAEVFVADNLSRGTLTAGGSRYRWLPRNASWTSWAWQNEEGTDILNVRLRHYLGGYRGDVAGHGPVLTDFQKELALLGWYLLLLDHQGFGTHLLAAIKLRLAKKHT